MERGEAVQLLRLVSLNEAAAERRYRVWRMMNGGGLRAPILGAQFPPAVRLIY